MGLALPLQRLATPGSLLGYSKESLGLGTQGVSRSRPGEEKSSGRGEELSLKSNNPTPKVGNKYHNKYSCKDNYQYHYT